MIFWGHKAVGFLDIWSIEHLLSGISFGALLCTRPVAALEALPKTYYVRYYLYKLLFFTFLWECFEHYIEVGLLGHRVQFWFHGVEHWSNRLISDPLLVVLGFFLVKKYKKFLVPARIISVIFLFFHVFVFPHSMYLH